MLLQQLSYIGNGLVELARIDRVSSRDQLVVDLLDLFLDLLPLRCQRRGGLGPHRLKATIRSNDQGGAVSAHELESIETDFLVVGPDRHAWLDPLGRVGCGGRLEFQIDAAPISARLGVRAEEGELRSVELALLALPEGEDDSNRLRRRLGAPVKIIARERGGEILLVAETALEYLVERRLSPVIFADQDRRRTEPKIERANAAEIVYFDVEEVHGSSGRPRYAGRCEKASIMRSCPPEEPLAEHARIH